MRSEQAGANASNSESKGPQGTVTGALWFAFARDGERVGRLNGDTADGHRGIESTGLVHGWY